MMHSLRRHVPERSQAALAQEAAAGLGVGAGFAREFVPDDRFVAIPVPDAALLRIDVTAVLRACHELLDGTGRDAAA